jgi:Gas vesicle protein G
VGLITGLLTLPLAPVRGTVWLAERIYEQAEAEMYDEGAVHEGLLALERAREDGELSEEEIDAAEDALLERLAILRGFAGGDEDGRVE